MAKQKLTMMPGEKKVVLLSKQRGLPPLMVTMLKKTPTGVTVTVDPLYKENTRNKEHLPNGFYTLTGDRIHVTTSDPHVLAHELGHAKSDTELVGRLVQSRFLYPMMHLAPISGLISGVAVRGIKHPMVRAIAIGAPFLMSLPGMVAEAKASANGHEILRQAGASEKELALYRAKMVKYYLSYASLPAMTGVNMLLGHALGGAR